VIRYCAVTKHQIFTAPAFFNYLNFINCSQECVVRECGLGIVSTCCFSVPVSCIPYFNKNSFISDNNFHDPLRHDQRDDFEIYELGKLTQKNVLKISLLLKKITTHSCSSFTSMRFRIDLLTHRSNQPSLLCAHQLNLFPAMTECTQTCESI
jgi:hypothetical protein